MAQPPGILRRRFSVHPIQRKYFFLSLVPLIACAFLLIFLVFVPFHSPREPGLGNASPLEKLYVLRDVRLWLAVLASMLASGLLSYVVTNRFAGPLYRIEQILRRGKEGDLPSSVVIRRGDDLQELVMLLDGTFKTIASALIAINERQALAVKELAAIREKISAGSNGEILQGLEGIGHHLRETENILANFKLPISEASLTEPRG